MHTHSHDLGGEIFLVLDGQCEFVVEDDKGTCAPGQLICAPPRVKHTLHAVGEGQAGKATIDTMWIELRDTLQHVREPERRWSALAPRSMPSA